jgi:hypothetical protein
MCFVLASLSVFQTPVLYSKAESLRSSWVTETLTSVHDSSSSEWTRILICRPIKVQVSTQSFWIRYNTIWYYDSVLQFYFREAIFHIV